jgi:hypothetical protein
MDHSSQPLARVAWLGERVGRAAQSEACSRPARRANPVHSM